MRGDLDLWVWEFGVNPFPTWAKWIDEILPQIEANLRFLTELREGSRDYTLHLVICPKEFSSVRIPPLLARLSLDAGFGIEIAFSSEA